MTGDRPGTEHGWLISASLGVSSRPRLPLDKVD